MRWWSLQRQREGGGGAQHGGLLHLANKRFVSLVLVSSSMRTDRGTEKGLERERSGREVPAKVGVALVGAVVQRGGEDRRGQEQQEQHGVLQSQD